MGQKQRAVVKDPEAGDGTRTGPLTDKDQRIVELLAQVAFLEAKEVCYKPHDDDVIEGCPYCEIERLRDRIAIECDVDLTMAILESQGMYKTPNAPYRRRRKRCVRVQSEREQE